MTPAFAPNLLKETAVLGAHPPEARYISSTEISSPGSGSLGRMLESISTTTIPTHATSIFSICVTPLLTMFL